MGSQQTKIKLAQAIKLADALEQVAPEITRNYPRHELRRTANALLARLRTLAPTKPPGVNTPVNRKPTIA